MAEVRNDSRNACICLEPLPEQENRTVLRHNTLTISYGEACAIAQLASHAAGNFDRALRLIRLAEDHSFNLTCSADKPSRVVLKLFDLDALVALYVIAYRNHNGSPHRYTILRFSADGLAQEIDCPRRVANLISMSEGPSEAIKHELARLVIT